MVRTTPTKQAIIDAALYLFHLNGFHATSIRDIAKKANVNPANIAYYFNNKQGLLEFCFTTYLEEYVQLMDMHISTMEKKGPQTCLLELIEAILQFHRKNYLAASFIHGEFSLNSVLNREVFSTYMTKEKYYFQSLLEAGIKARYFRAVPVTMYILQLKGLITAPIIHSQYAMEVLHVFPQEPYYTKKYSEEVARFLQETLFFSNNMPYRDTTPQPICF